MKRMAVLALAGLAVTSGTALASSPEGLSPFSSDVLPVLVKVNNDGHVTSAVPAVKLRPQLERLMERNLEEMITGPALRHGRPVASRFVANLVLKTTAREDGQTGAHFTFVSVSPVPAGRWHWVSKDDQQLALMEQQPYSGSSIDSSVLHPGSLEPTPQRISPTSTPTTISSPTRAPATSNSTNKRG